MTIASGRFSIEIRDHRLLVRLRVHGEGTYTFPITHEDALRLSTALLRGAALLKGIGRHREAPCAWPTS